MLQVQKDRRQGILGRDQKLKERKYGETDIVLVDGGTDELTLLLAETLYLEPTEAIWCRGVVLV